MSFLGYKKQTSYFTYFCQQIEGEIRCNGKRLSLWSLCVCIDQMIPIFKKKIKVGNFFSKLGKELPKFHWEWAEFQPLRTHKKIPV